MLLLLFLVLRRSPALRLSRLPKLSVTEADQRTEPRESILRSLICALAANAVGSTRRSMPRLEAGQRRGARTPCKVSGAPPPIRKVAPPIRKVAEALRRQPRGSQRVLEVSSPFILMLVRRLLSLS